MGNDTSSAQSAADSNSQLMNEYSNVGVPAIRANMNYATQSLNQGQPQYITDAYKDAKTGALESSVANTSARAQLTRNLSKAGGGAYLGGMGGQQLSNSQALSNETSHIATTQALTGLEQRNKLLNVLSGSGASGTNLSAGFGQLTNEGLGQSAGANNPFGLIAGGASALSSIYANSQMKNQQSSLAATQQGNYAANIGAGSWDMS